MFRSDLLTLQETFWEVNKRKISHCIETYKKRFSKIVVLWAGGTLGFSCLAPRVARVGPEQRSREVDGYGQSQVVIRVKNTSSPSSQQQPAANGLRTEAGPSLRTLSLSPHLSVLNRLSVCIFFSIGVIALSSFSALHCGPDSQHSSDTSAGSAIPTIRGSHHPALLTRYHSMTWLALHTSQS